MNKVYKNSPESGYTLIELVIVVIIVGILASVVGNSLGSAVDVSRQEETMTEMNRLAYAIAGNPDKVSGGNRTDYGYIGDNGAPPPNWNALVVNPGGYLTWDGPYLHDIFSSGGISSEFRLDAWGNPYSSPAGSAFSSSGGGATITRQYAHSLDALLYNRVTAVIVDIDNNPPGSDYMDSVRLALTFPDGSGGYSTVLKYPGRDGFVSYDSIPIGIHALRLVYIPEADTMMRRINVNPGSNPHIDIQYHSDVW